jgi:hypothetical protein
MTSRLKKAANTPLGSIGGAIAGIASYEGLKHIFDECTTAAKAQHQAVRELGVTMTSVPGQTKATVSAFEKYADTMEQVYKVNHKVSMAAATSLSFTGLHEKDIERITPYVLGYAQLITHKVNPSIEEMTTVTKSFGKAFIGNLTPFKRAGIALTKHQQDILKTGTLQEKLNLVTMKFGNRGVVKLLTANAGSDLGKQADIANKMDKIKETAGDPLLELQNAFNGLLLSIAPVAVMLVKDLKPAIVTTVEKIKDVVDKIKRWSDKDPDLVATLATVTIGILAFVAVAGPVATVIETLSAIPAVIGAISAALQAGGIAAGIEAAFAAWPVLLVIAAVVIVAGLVYLVEKNWGKIKGFFINLWVGVKKAFANFWKWLQGSSPMAKLLKWIPLVALSLLVINNWDKLKKWFGEFKDFMINLWKSIVSSPAFKTFIKAMSVVGNAVGKAGNWVGKEASAAWNWGTTDTDAPKARAMATTGRAIHGKPGEGGKSQVDITLNGFPKGTKIKSNLAHGHSLMRNGTNNVAF